VELLFSPFTRAPDTFNIRGRSVNITKGDWVRGNVEVVTSFLGKYAFRTLPCLGERMIGISHLTPLNKILGETNEEKSCGYRRGDKEVAVHPGKYHTGVKFGLLDFSGRADLLSGINFLGRNSFDRTLSSLCRDAKKCISLRRRKKCW
jgi:hypothetical protein